VPCGNLWVSVVSPHGSRAEPVIAPSSEDARKIVERTRLTAASDDAEYNDRDENDRRQNRDDIPDVVSGPPSVPDEVHSACQGAYDKDQHEDEWAILRGPPELAWGGKEQQRSQDDHQDTDDLQDAGSPWRRSEASSLRRGRE
jgi:hypothetical protein